MLILITYDVCTKDKLGVKRLNKVAKICENYGIRVQNSVFECVVDNQEFLQLKHQLTKTINEENDSLRFYNLGKNYKNKVIHIGSKKAVDVTQTLIF